MTTAADTNAPVSAPVKGRSLWADARRRLFSNTAAVVSMIILAILTLAAIFGPMVWVHDFEHQYRDRVLESPTLVHWHIMGTDNYGRDMFARVLFGLRVSLAVALVATLVSLVIGVVWGAVAGYRGGRTDQIMMRIVDIIYSLPFIFFVIILTVTIGAHLESPVQKVILLFAAIGAVEWLTMARIVRGQSISLKHKEFVEAARAAGAGSGAIIRRHIVPNLLGPVVVYVTLTIPAVILAEAFLSFLGMGISEPLTSLGQLISLGAGQMEIASWLLIYPALTMVVTLVCFNFIGDGLRDAIDPKDR